MAEKGKLLNFRMPETEAHQLERQAKTVAYRSVSDFIREAIREKMAREQASAVVAGETK